MEPMHWLLLFILFLIIELLTVGLTTIWFAGGAVAAMAVNLLGGNIWAQIIVFLAVSFVLLLFTRPFAARYINRGHVKTNVDDLVGKEAVVQETIDNLAGTGKALVNGMEWTARANEKNNIIEKGSIVEILRIEGVKIIVKEKETKK